MENQLTPDPATNARLCEWLGVEPVTYEGPHGKSHDRQYEYPELATRDGFWLLWDALRNHPRYFRPEVWATISGACAKIGGTLVYHGETPEAALFAAAVALMEREEQHETN